MGQEVTVDDFTFTVTKVSFMQNVPFEYISTDTTPILEFATAKEGYTWLSYYVDIAFHGKKKVLARNAFLPSVQYGDNYDTFATNYFMEKCVDGKWDGLRSNFKEAPYYGVDDYNFMYDPYVDHTFSLHGAIEVPIKVVDDKASSLVLELYIPSEMDTIPDAPSLSIATGTGKYARFDVRSVQ